MNIIKQFHLFPLMLLFLYGFLFPGCQKLTKTQAANTNIVTTNVPTTVKVTPTRTLLPFVTNTEITTATLESTASPSATNTEGPKRPVLTPLPTLSATDASRQIVNLIKTNSVCKFPCWWGLHPGKTTWKAAYQILAPLASEEVDLRNIQDDHNFIAEFRFIVEAKNIDQMYLIRNSIIDLIEVRFGEGHSYTLPALLNTNGVPEEIWIRTYNEDVQGGLPFGLLIGYPSKGILAWYESLDAKVIGDKVQKCYTNDQTLVLDLWDPGQKENLEQVSKIAPLFEAMVPFDNYQRLEMTTDLNINTFYKTFRNPAHCLNTYTKFWKSPFE